MMHVPGRASREQAIKNNHIPRPDPYPDETGDTICTECETLCILPDRPCLCCWVDMDITDVDLL